MITLLTILAVIFTGVLMLVMGAGILTFGELISKTPDMLERHGDRKEPTDIPARHARAFVTALWAIFFIGAVLVLLGQSVQIEVVGGVIIFAALLFSGTIMFLSMQIYSLMRKNMVELKDSVVA
jgi:uncharacterized membrane protein